MAFPFGKEDSTLILTGERRKTTLAQDPAAPHLGEENPNQPGLLLCSDGCKHSYGAANKGLWTVRSRQGFIHPRIGGAQNPSFIAGQARGLSLIHEWLGQGRERKEKRSISASALQSILAETQPLVFLTPIVVLPSEHESNLPSGSEDKESC